MTRVDSFKKSRSCDYKFSRSPPVRGLIRPTQQPVWGDENISRNSEVCTVNLVCPGRQEKHYKAPFGLCAYRELPNRLDTTTMRPSNG